MKANVKENEKRKKEKKEKVEENPKIVFASMSASTFLIMNRRNNKCLALHFLEICQNE